MSPLFDFSARHDAWWNALPASPRDAGRVVALVVRPRSGQSGTRMTPDSIEVDPKLGVEGDRWFESEHQNPDMHVSLVNTHVLRTLARACGEVPAISGDNLEVDLCLSEENLPVGTKLHVGSAILELSPKPHTGCDKFAARFTKKGLKQVRRANQRGLRARGAYCRVMQAGEIRVGDEIRVERG